MRLRPVVLSFVLALAAVLGGWATARAEEDAFGGSFITPFPAGDVYTVEVVGDDLADGLLSGLVESFQGDTRVTFNQRAYKMNGLMRPDFAVKLQDLESELKEQPVHIAIVMMGVWDRVTLRDPQGKRLQVGSEGWKAEYAARADRLMKTLKRRNVAVYWVGMPNLRRYDANEAAQMMNDIVRERIYLNGLKYIDAYAGFVDEQGGYSAYGPDETGKIRLLRDGDGTWFTDAGNRKLAHFVERDLKRDITQAKADRNIPLAGSEAEQAKINPDKAPLADAAGAAPSQGSQTPALTPSGSAPPAPVTATGGEQKADNSKINLRMVSPNGHEELVTLDIVRPAISANLIALVTRRESPDKPSQMGEVMVDQIAGGVTVMNTVALPSSGGDRRRLSPAQTPYFRVLFKGERLPPKPGRADDTSLPPAPTAAADLSLETGATDEPPPDKAADADATGGKQKKTGQRSN